MAGWPALWPTQAQLGGAAPPQRHLQLGVRGTCTSAVECQASWGGIRGMQNPMTMLPAMQTSNILTDGWVQGVLLSLQQSQPAAVQVFADGVYRPAATWAPNSSAASGTHWLTPSGSLLLALSDSTAVVVAEVPAARVALQIETADGQAVPLELAAALQTLPEQLMLTQAAEEG